MNSASIINNKFNGNDYRVSIVPVHKRISIPGPLSGVADGIKLEPMEFDSIIFEAAIFVKKSFLKPFFVIELDDYSKKTTAEEFAKFIHHIIANEKIDTLMNFGKGLDDAYHKYGFMAARHDIWSLFVLGRIRTIFIFKDSYRN